MKTNMLKHMLMQIQKHKAKWWSFSCQPVSSQSKPEASWHKQT